MALNPAENPEGIGSRVGDRRRLDAPQRLQILQAQLDDPDRDLTADAELRQSIARLQRTVDAPQPRLVEFQGTVHEFPAQATDDDIRAALEQITPAAPAASQRDVRAAEPQPSPMEAQKEKEERFEEARKRFIQETGGALKPGQGIRQAVAEWSGIQDPDVTRGQAEIAEVGEGGDLQYGNTAPYQGGKVLASIGGFATGGPAGATGAEALVRLVALTSNLKKAVDAGAITEDRAAEIMAKEMAKGTAEDAAFNVGLPLLGQVLAKVPGVRPLIDKVAARLGAAGPAADEAAQRARALKKLGDQAPTPAGKQAVEEIGKRTKEVIPTPGQVTGEGGWAENASRAAHPSAFKKPEAEIAGAVEGMREDLVNPSVQPSAKGLGEQITQAAEDVQKAVKTRLRPTFEEADSLGVKVDLDPVLVRAKAALAADAAVKGGRLKPAERADLERMVAEMEGTSQSGLARNTQSSAEAALDFISRQKEKLRAVTADGKPSQFYDTILNGLAKDADQAFSRAAQGAGRGDIVQKLAAAQTDYREMMSTVYDDAVKQALKKNPEDVGRLFWTSGNVSEIEQLQKMLTLAQREGSMAGGAAKKLSRDMIRGFLQEAVPTLESAAKWSETLKANPLKRRTWETLTAAPGGAQLRGAMEVLEEAAKISARGNQQLLGESYIALQRAARGGLGVSYVTGVIHPGIAVAGLSIDALTRMAATAYTQGNKGILNTMMRALRANSAGTAASAKALQEALPEIEKFAAANGIDDIFVGQQEQ